jgi:glycosyltransferase involved in cell wall biosynthesis
MNISYDRPTVTVLMPVYNGERYLKEAVSSILCQTFDEFEFLIVNDGSTDDSVDIIRSFSDPRIQLVHNQENLKLIATLNKGIELSRGKYIARMDSDDISLPDRLAKQLDFMEKRPGVGICGTWSRTFSDGAVTWETKFPTDHETIKAHLLLNTAISHPTAMFNAPLLRKWGLRYETSAIHAEDYDLWCRASDVFSLANVPEILFLYRMHAGQISKEHASTQSRSAQSIRRRMLTRLGLNPNDKQMEIHLSLCREDYKQEMQYVSDVATWLSAIYLSNRNSFYCARGSLQLIFTRIWMDVCKRNQSSGFDLLVRHVRNKMVNKKVNLQLLRLFASAIQKQIVSGFVSVLNS